jgi:hypothetical protein
VTGAGTVAVTVKPNRAAAGSWSLTTRYAVRIRLWVSCTPTNGTQRDLLLYGPYITYPKQFAAAAEHHTVGSLRGKHLRTCLSDHVFG